MLLFPKLLNLMMVIPLPRGEEEASKNGEEEGSASNECLQSDSLINLIKILE
jgi:hypothetical protein